jgi:hypothetical protein
MNAEVTLSELLNKPKATLARLDGSRRVILHRRDAEDLVLTTAGRASQDSEVIATTTRMFVSMMKRDPEARALVMDVVPEVFPWVRFLPGDGVREFAVELVDTLRAATDLDNAAAVAVMIAQWRHTAEIHSDPELHAALARPITEVPDLGPVTDPGAAE